MIVSMNEWTAEMWLALVKQKDMALTQVPENLRTLEMCRAAVKLHSEEVKIEPENVEERPEIWSEVVKASWRLLFEYIPENLRTRIAEEAGIDYRVSETNSEDNEEYGESRMTLDLSDMDETYKTPEFCLEAVKLDGMTLEQVPKVLRTPEVCLAAVKQNWQALRFVPGRLRTAAVWLEVVKQEGWALYSAPERLKTEGPEAVELCLAAVKQNGMVLKYVPDHLKTMEVCVAALLGDNNTLNYIPENLKIEAFLAALSRITEEGDTPGTGESGRCSLSLEEVESGLNATRERIRQIEAKAQQRLRDIGSVTDTSNSSINTRSSI